MTHDEPDGKSPTKRPKVRSSNYPRTAGSSMYRANKPVAIEKLLFTQNLFYPTSPAPFINGRYYNAIDTVKKFHSLELY
jgi:hypothetical protein